MMTRLKEPEEENRRIYIKMGGEIFTTRDVLK